MLSLLLLLLASPVHAESVKAIVADPPIVSLSGPDARYTLLIHGNTADGRQIDLTHEAEYRSSAPAVALVSTTGMVRAVADGTAQIEVHAAGKSSRVMVRVEGTTRPRRFNFENDLIPILNRYGCNAAGCHGKAEGQNGFKLSVFGFDPAADHAALTKEDRGRRIFFAAPERSLLLLKMSGQVPHGGGTRIPRDSLDYEFLRTWIAAGAPFGNDTDPKVVSIRLEPHENVLAMHGRQQLRVMARYADGREVDATPYARFQSNNEGLATVSGSGLVTAAESPGDVAVMAAYGNAVDVFRAFIPRSQRVMDYPQVPENNFIDRLVFAKLRKLNVVPSEPASDAEYLRRLYLDLLGTLPTAAEARRFLADTRPDRRARLVEELLERPEYADYWALQWADMLRVDRQALGQKYAYQYYRWIREGLAANKPLDRFAREIVTAEGPLRETGPANFYKVVTRPGDQSAALAQVFLGIRLACAECHHHPFDRWSQDDYCGMQAYFAPLAIRGGAQGEELIAAGDPPTTNPRTGRTIPAHALEGTATVSLPAAERRQALADWMTAPQNPWFARNLANRLWAHFLGRGLVEPVDDVRATNPPTNPELLDALAGLLVESHYDVRPFIRTIAASRVYQLSSRPNATNERDEQNYSRALLRRVDAEVLLDMVCQTTGVPERFLGMPAGSRAIQLWDSKLDHYFLKLFGRPVRASTCSCERNQEPGVAQVLHLLNSPEINAKLSDDAGTLARLVRTQPDEVALIDELYLTFYSRHPDEAEKNRALKYLRERPRKRLQAAEDLAWSLLNSLEFCFNH